MSFDLILGPMFAGKTSFLIQKALEAKTNNTKTLCVNHSMDTRYNKHCHLETHDGKSHEETNSTQNLMDVTMLQQYKTSQLIIIDEAHFYTDIREFILLAVDTHKKHVIAAGLDGDVRREMFQPIQSILPLADSITKLKAKCSCSDNAVFTIRKNADQSKEIQVGGAELYESVCRKHFYL